ncbi:MAG: class I SAM-dependent methyltransferase [Actinomycetes bacterium]
MDTDPGRFADETHWRDSLAAWAIPEQIMNQAPTNPWIHPVAQFTVVAPVADSPSHTTARAALPEAGSVLDVGCGGGRGALALTPPAGHWIGVDHQQDMLDTFAAAAQSQGVTHEEILGDWPDVADRTPIADVVVCHHVVYNVAELSEFIAALTTHARHRVVLELPLHHPLTWMNPLWKQFWDLDRPTEPSAHDALGIIRGGGHDAHIIEFTEESSRSSAMDTRAAAEATCQRLCLPLDRVDDVAAAASIADQASPRRLATIWWDV